MSVLRMLRKWSVAVLEVLGGILLMSMTIIVFLGIIDRFWLHIGLPWPEELARYHLVWLSFLSAALAVTNKGHYVLDFFYRKIFQHFGQRRIMECVNNLLVCVVSLVLLVKAAELVKRVAWQGAPAMKFSMSWTYVSIPLSLGFIVFFYLVQIMEIILYRGNDAEQNIGR
jgi:TRAP-type C4-dicarboxylate transport system permease small subunit